MKKFIYFFLIINLVTTKTTYSQSEKINGNWNLGLGIEFALGIFPSRAILYFNDSKLNNKFFLSYNLDLYNVERFKPAFELGYKFSYFNKFGVFCGLSYAHYSGIYGYYNGQKYNGYSTIENLDFIRFQSGFFYRYIFPKFGTLESNINLVLQQSLRGLPEEYKRNNPFMFAYPNIELIYYFKRNKPKK